MAKVAAGTGGARGGTTKKKITGNRWDLHNWTQGKVTLFQALGIKKGTLDWPKLTPEVTKSSLESGGQLGKQNQKFITGGVGSQGEAANKRLGQRLARAYGWGSGSQWEAFNSIVMAESGWNNQAQNPTSTAYGIGQFLDTTWSTVGISKTSDPTTQINGMLRYIKERYGSPEAAWSFHLANGWY